MPKNEKEQKKAKEKDDEKTGGKTQRSLKGKKQIKEMLTTREMIKASTTRKSKKIK